VKEVTVRDHQGATATDLLAAIVTAEAAAQDFYDRMALAFAHHPAARQLWESMRADEAQHLAAVSRIRACLPREQREQPIPASDLAAVLRQQETLSEARISAIQNLHDAYELAHEPEDLEMSRLGLFLTRFVAESERGGVMREVLAHQAKLAAFRRTSTGRQWMRTVLAGRPSGDHAGD
jgi:hypothetical protein